MPKHDTPPPAVGARGGRCATDTAPPYRRKPAVVDHPGGHIRPGDLAQAHGHWDGSGLPGNVSGEAVALPARVVMAASLDHPAASARMEPMAAVAVVTGAGSGLGRVIARALLDGGFAVALAGRTPDTLQEAAQGHPNAVTVPTDTTDPASVAALFAAVKARWGRVDLLVNNAGTFGPVGGVDEIAVQDWIATVNVNLTGYFLCAAEAVRMMRAQDPQGGRIINNGSISATSPRPGTAAYTATKHAVTGLTKALSLDGRAHNIACGQIDIGNAATDMTAGFAAGARQADGSVKKEPTFDAHHVGEAVLHMARLPLGANVQFMTLMATTMPLVGRG